MDTEKGQLLAAVLLLVLAACSGGREGEDIVSKSKSDEVVMVGSSDPDMLAAFSKARSTLDEFLSAAANPAPGTDSHAVKVKITDGSRVEYFWVSPFMVEKDGFSGEISNTPETVSNVVEGQQIRFKRDDVFDWTYNRDGKMQGNFTACALLKRESAEDVAAFKAEYGLDCRT